MDEESVQNRQGQLYLLGARGYSAYEVAVLNGYVGTEEEWLESLVGPQGEPGTPFGDLTPEQKEELRGPQGKSAYQVAVDNGFIGTEQEWVNSFLTPDGYYTKGEADATFVKEEKVVKQLSENTSINPVIGIINANGHSIISSSGQTFNNCIVRNAKLNFDNIATETSEPGFSYYNAHVLFKNEVIFEECEFTSEHVTRVDFRSNSKITFKNCRFTNIYLHFSGDNGEGPKTIKIRDCEFTQTIANITGTYGSTEYLHITNSQNTLENCIVEGNLFDTSSQDCIDVFPNGSNILINGNTFINCSNRIMEIKMQKQEGTELGARGVIISNNFFKNILDNTKCIVTFNRDETEDVPEDLTLYPKVIYSNNIFVNERNDASGIDCFYIYENVKTQISNCKTIGFDKVASGMFIHLRDSQINVSNCITQSPYFIFEDNASNTSKMWVSNCDALDDLVSDSIGSVRYVNELYMSNCRFRYPLITQASNILFMTNCKLANKLQLSKGKYFVTNCDLVGLTDNSDSGTDAYVSISNSITANAITSQTYIILDNVLVE